MTYSWIFVRKQELTIEKFCIKSNQNVPNASTIPLI